MLPWLWPSGKCPGILLRGDNLEWDLWLQEIFEMCCWLLQTSRDWQSWTLQTSSWRDISPPTSASPGWRNSPWSTMTSMWVTSSFHHRHCPFLTQYSLKLIATASAFALGGAGNAVLFCSPYHALIATKLYLWINIIMFVDHLVDNYLLHSWARTCLSFDCQKICLKCSSAHQDEIN